MELSKLKYLLLETENNIPNDNPAVFGEVVEGLEVIDSVAAQPVGFASRPLENIVFSIKILE